jgi:hypothetical protein
MDTTISGDRYEVGFLLGLITLLTLMAISAYLMNMALLHVSSNSSTEPTPHQHSDIYV